MFSTPSRFIRLLMVAGVALGAFACDSDDADDTEAVGEDTGPLLAVSSSVYADEDGTSYVSLFDELDGQELDLSKAREFNSAADLWVHDGAVFIADGEKNTITKYAVRGRVLEQVGRIGFSDYGLKEFGFWLNTFVADDKAYFINGTTEYIVWNPKTMDIKGTIDFPKLEERDGLKPFPSYTDRSTAQRGKLLYHPIYWSDGETFFEYTQNSSIIVIDTEKDEIADVLDVPCPGMDFATTTESGDIYFSSWVFAPGGAAVADQPATCAIKLPADSDEPEVAFKFSDVVDGNEGGALRYIGDGKALVSVLHADHASEEAKDDIEMVAWGANWRFWTLDLESKEATEIEAIDWNAGAAYGASANEKAYILVPAGDYTSTTVYELKADDEPEAVLETPGWAMRLFQVR